MKVYESEGKNYITDFAYQNILTSFVNLKEDELIWQTKFDLMI